MIKPSTTGAAIVALSLGALIMYFKHFSKYKPHENSEPYVGVIRIAEQQYGLPHNMLMRLLEQESHFDPLAYNRGSDAQGIAQIVPRWHPEIADPFDPNEAIPYAARYLKRLYNYFGYWDLALAAYNWGRGNLSKHMAKYGEDGFSTMPRETRNYVSNILADVNVSEIGLAA